MTEIRVLDTYWSDHCRHTTFSTELTDVEKQIANAELDSSDTRTSAEKSYTRSVEDQASDQASAQQELAKAQQEYDTLGLNDYYSTMTTDGNTGKTNREVVTDWYTRYAEEIAGYENTLANLQIQLTQARQARRTAPRDCRARSRTIKTVRASPRRSAASRSWGCRALTR